MPILFLMATGMAAFLDFSIGALIVFILGQANGFEVQVWQIAIGGVLALLPDFDVILGAARPLFKDKSYKGDHRATIMHRPLVMLPACTLVGGWFGGSFWATVTFLCLLYHYIHDIRIFSVGDIDWFWPFNTKELPWMDTKEWLKKYWLQPTKTSVVEMLVSTTVLGYVVNIYTDSQVAIIFAILVITANIMTWTLYRCIR